MITRFQTSGAIAGIENWSCALRIPTARPLRPSRTMIGNRTCESPAHSASSAGVNSSPVKTGITTGASQMNSSAIAPSATSSRPASVLASCSASRRRLCSSRSLKTGTNADESAASATSARIRFGIWKASVKAEAAPLVPK